MNFERANIADLSRMHIPGAIAAFSGEEYFVTAWVAILMRGGKNFPSIPVYINDSSVILWSI